MLTKVKRTIKNKIKEMYLFFSILCFLFLAFNFEVVPGRPWHNHYALFWKWKEYLLIRIFPKNVFVLVHHDKMYRYIHASLETYVSAVQLDNRMSYEILNYRYILDWIKEPPVVKSYPSKLSTEVDILNYLRTA